MNRRWLAAWLLIVFALPLSGCPGGSSVALGLWLMCWDGTTPIIGYSLLANGQVDEYEVNSKPPGASSIFSGELTWQQNGNDFTMLQDGYTYDRIFNGTLDSPTYITGTWEDLGGPMNSGTFIASKAPVN